VELHSVLLEPFMELLASLSRNTRLSTLTGRKNLGDEWIHREPSRLKPPAGIGMS